MFGVPLSVNIRKTGQALPPAIFHAIQYLRDTGGLDTKGLFRRAAAKAKIDLLKVINEANPGRYQVYVLNCPYLEFKVQFKRSDCLLYAHSFL